MANVDNTSDANKPISTATQTALNLKAPLASPTFTGTVSGITQAMVGLGNVDNTNDLNKPISNATQTALDLKAPLASPTFTGTVSGITKSMVGLGNVDNTTDLNKPISTATQSALDLKAPLASPSLTGTPLAPTAMAGTNTTQIATTAFVGTAISNLVASAPSTLDTLNELAIALGNDANFSTTITNAIGGKVAKSGDTMTGFLTLSAAPTSNLHAATKQYVDSSVTSLSNTASSTYIPQSDAGNPDGVATLDANGYVPMSQLVNLINNAPANLDTLGEIYNYMLDREIDIIMGAA